MNKSKPQQHQQYQHQEQPRRATTLRQPCRAIIRTVCLYRELGIPSSSQRKRKYERFESNQTPRLSAHVLQATEPWEGTSDGCNDVTRFTLAQSVALPTITLVLLDGSNKQNELVSCSQFCSFETSSDKKITFPSALLCETHQDLQLFALHHGCAEVLLRDMVFNFPPDDICGWHLSLHFRACGKGGLCTKVREGEHSGGFHMHRRRFFWKKSSGCSWSIERLHAH